jgi:glyoxylase-like metal-dependent hydrolase (beta-lactamase superfamily II)
MAPEGPLRSARGRVGGKQTRNGPFCIVGDTIYWYSNIEMPWVPGYNQGNAFHSIYTYDRIRTLLKNETRRIVPGHDPVLWERHPSWIIGGENNQVAELNLADYEKSRRVKWGSQRHFTTILSNCCSK